MSVGIIGLGYVGLPLAVGKINQNQPQFCVLDLRGITRGIEASNLARL